MYTATNTCPVCGGEMIVTGLECRACASELRGRFALGRLYRLNPEQMHFVETLVKNRGNVSKAGDELDLTYATARSRLDDVIASLGYEVVPEEEPPSLSPEQRKLVLEQLARGAITSEDAVEMLRSGQVKVEAKASGSTEEDDAVDQAEEPASD